MVEFCSKVLDIHVYTHAPCCRIISSVGAKSFELKTPAPTMFHVHLHYAGLEIVSAIPFAR